MLFSQKAHVCGESDCSPNSAGFDFEQGHFDLGVSVKKCYTLFV
jgi:hypothetical protein